MKKEKIPMTQAVRLLKEHKAQFRLCPYDYEEKGGTSRAAAELGLDEHQVIKTLVMEDDNKEPLLILMHGDRSVSTKALARSVGAKSVTTCDPQSANRHTGYQVGGISPFGTRRALKVYVEKTILDLPLIYINAGKRGLLAEMPPGELVRILKTVPVEVARV